MKISSRWFVFTLLVLMFPTRLFGQVFTDAFSQAGLLNMENVATSTVGATTEPGEPLNLLGTVQTVWAKIGDAPDGPFRVTVEGGGFVVATVYRGTGVAALTPLASDSNAETPSAEVVFTNVRADPIYLQVAAIGSPAPNLTVRLQPANDRFATPRNVDWSTLCPPLTNANSTAEADEPNTTAGQGHSVWFRWVVPRTATYHVSSQQASFARAIDIFRGESLATLQRVDGILKTSENGDGNYLTARAGEVFFIRVQRHSSAYPPEGFFTLYFVPLRPANDDFASRVELGTFGPFVEPISPSTLEPGEPQGNDGIALSGSVWFYFDAPTSGVATFDSLGSELDTVLRLYTAPTTNGVQLSDLTLLGANDNAGPATPQSLASAPVLAGQRIYVQLGAKAGSRDDGILQLRASVQPLASVHFTRSRVLWDGGAQPYYVSLERSGDPALGLTVALRWSHFDSTQEDVTVSFAAGEALVFLSGTLEFVGPLGGARGTTYELLEGALYDVGTPEYCDVIIEPVTPFVPARGSFRGMLDRTGHDVRGLGTVQVDTTATGAYTLKLTIAGRAFVLRGLLDAHGRISRVLNVPGLGRQIIDLRVDPLFPAVTGTVGDSFLYAARQISAPLARSFGVAGRRLVFSFIANAAGPQGAGYALGTVTVAGTVRVIGATPDGRGFACGTQIGADLSLPVYARLYDGKGVLHGYFVHGETPTPGWVARATWVKPATGSGELGAAVNQNLLGYSEIFQPLAVGAPLSGGFSQTAGAGALLVGLPGDQTLELPFQLGSASIATFTPNAQYLPRLAVDRRTGFFQGSVKLDTAPAQSFRGVFIPNLVIESLAGHGIGFLVQGTSSRPVRVVPRSGL